MILQLCSYSKKKVVLFFPFTLNLLFLEQVMKPFDEHLTALRDQILKPHVQYNEETLLEISNLIRTSEIFLKTAQVH